jgi:protein arginine kinase activator
MNCEKCKNRKATLFFTDDDGKRHALCALCGASAGKTVNLISPEQNADKRAQFLPESSLYSLLTPTDGEIMASTASLDRTVCRVCGISAEEIASNGRIGCPECYVSFPKLFFSNPHISDGSVCARMPSARRAKLDRERTLIEAKSELRRAIECENLELAATLRDKIRGLEKQ